MPGVLLFPSRYPCEPSFSSRACVACTSLAPARASSQLVFHSVQSANLPTAETMAKGSWLFEISHRFFPPVSDGASALWGLDGPARDRLGLSYSLTDRATVGILRSNYEDNVELNGKLSVLRGGLDGPPLEVTAMAGVAWNTQSPSMVQGAEDNEVQAYGQIVLNAGLGDRLALGVVPTYLRNPGSATWARATPSPSG